MALPIPLDQGLHTQTLQVSHLDNLNTLYQILMLFRQSQLLPRWPLFLPLRE